MATISDISFSEEIDFEPYDAASLATEAEDWFKRTKRIDGFSSLYFKLTAQGEMANREPRVLTIEKKFLWEQAAQNLNTPLAPFLEIFTLDESDFGGEQLAQFALDTLSFKARLEAQALDRDGHLLSRKIWQVKQTLTLL